MLYKVVLASAPQEVDQLRACRRPLPRGSPTPRSSRSAELSSAASPQLLVLHVVVCNARATLPGRASPRVHGLSSSAVSMLALQLGSSVPFFLSATLECHGSFGGGYLGLFLFFFFVIPCTHRAALPGFQGLKGCFQQFTEERFCLDDSLQLVIAQPAPPK